MKRHPWLLLLVVAAVSALAGCSSNSNRLVAPNSASTGFGLVTLRITDAPAMFDHVNLDMNEVWVHRVNDGTPGDTLGDCDSLRDSTRHGRDGHHGRGHRREHGDRGVWIQLNTTPGIIDVLSLQDGVFATLGTDSVPTGHYDQIKLVLGTENTIVVDSVSHPLEVPGDCRAGFRLVGHFEVPESGGADIGIDFDAARSIHETRDGRWYLRPVVRIAPLGTTGRIAGSVRPFYVKTWVFALQGADTLASARTHAGRFTLSLLPPGGYTLAFAPRAGFRDTTVADVSVSMNRTTDVGPVVLTPLERMGGGGLSANAAR